MEVVEIAIGAIVASVIVGLFFVIAAGYGHAIDGGDES
jgi:multicomponent Na+:H+ antiporter subunit B